MRLSEEVINEIFRITFTALQRRHMAGWMLNDCEIIKAVGQDRHFILGMQGAVKAAGPFTYKNITQAKDALSDSEKLVTVFPLT